MLHRACCHTCYTVQLAHYSRFKTHSLQHLKPLKSKKRVYKYKHSGGDPLKMVEKRDRNM
jgi:hypothetical protein